VLSIFLIGFRTVRTADSPKHGPCQRRDILARVTPLAVVELYVFILAGFVGFKVITRVPPLLHTPLMSATNAISGISLVGSLVAAGSDHGLLANVLGAIAVASATINVVGGFIITDRMLKMFRRQPNEGKSAPPRH
jgi:NAD(P) transhydrogenase subunit alpha